MSLRIKKYIGYALKFPKPCRSAKDGYDERLKNNPFVFRDILEGNRDRYSLDGAIAYGKLNSCLDGKAAKFADPAIIFANADADAKYKNIPRWLGHHITLIYNGDDAEGYIIVPPVHYTEWQRFDDYIDHYEYQMSNAEHDYTTIWQWIDYGLYPYIGLIDRRTGKTFSDGAVVNAAFKSQIKDKEAVILSRYGFASYEEYNATIIPNIPPIIQSICQYTSLFAKNDGWLDLRPAIVTYWS